MKKELRERAEQYADETHFPYQVYFSTYVPSANYKTQKYFFKYYQTNKVAESFTTQKELDEFLTGKGY